MSKLYNSGNPPLLLWLFYPPLDQLQILTRRNQSQIDVAGKHCKLAGKRQKSPEKQEFLFFDSPSTGFGLKI